MSCRFLICYDGILVLLTCVYGIAHSKAETMMDNFHRRVNAIVMTAYCNDLTFKTVSVLKNCFCYNLFAFRNKKFVRRKAILIYHDRFYPILDAKI